MGDHCTPWYQQGGILFSIGALVVASIALWKAEDHSQEVREEEFRRALVGLQENVAPPSADVPDRSSRSRAWLYYDAARRLEPKLRSVSPVDCLILANFAYTHS